MVSAIDTNILLDILIPNPKYLLKSKLLLENAVTKGALIICEIVYSELASQFNTKREVDRVTEN
jgi:hypothetical protein